MPHISLPEGLPGIIGPMTAYPDTAKPLNELAEVLLRGSEEAGQGRFHQDPERRTGRREPLAAHLSSRCERRTVVAEPLRRTGLDDAGPDLRTLSAQGHNRRGVGRRHSALGPGVLRREA